ncbi:hypothetical protein [Nonomuraea candida]|uniref:hypothetical protein n=1 Tax=Nonomuraea candida TaxID=359159 RepID=UPI0005BDE214
MVASTPARDRPLLEGPLIDLLTGWVRNGTDDADADAGRDAGADWDADWDADGVTAEGRGGELSAWPQRSQ